MVQVNVRTQSEVKVHLFDTYIRTQYVHTYHGLHSSIYVFNIKNIHSFSRIYAALLHVIPVILTHDVIPPSRVRQFDISGESDK